MKNFILKQGGALLCAVIAVFTLNLLVRAQGTETPDEPQTQSLEETQGMEVGVFLFDEETQEYIPVQPLTVIQVMLDGQELAGDVPAFLYEERTLFPLRLVSEAMGATVDWNEETRSAVVTREETTLVFTIDAPTALVNGEERELPDGVGPCLASLMEVERTMVPLRFLAETLDFQIQWEEATQTVYLTAGRAPVEEQEPLALSGFYVALDAGHGGWSSGAYYEKISEKDLDLTVTLRVAELLEEKGCKVLLTREDDTFVSLGDRCQIANDAGVDIFVSIHANASEVSKTFQGIYTYYYPGKTQGRALAKALQNAMVQETGAIDRGVLSEDFAVVRKTEMPASLVEIGFMSCHEELLRLCDPDYQEKLARGIAQGIEDYLTK